MPGARKIPRAVRLDRTFTVYPASPSQTEQHCKLCSSDLQMLCCNYIQKGLIYSMADAAFDFRSVAELLKNSLSETLVHFYPLAGRLTTLDGEVYIDCNDFGVDFMEASAPEVGVAEIMVENVGGVVRELFAMDGAININGHSLPLLAVQVTKLKDGVAVGFTVNHCVVDGTALWHFINTWSQLSSSSSSSLINALPPLHTRCFTTGTPIKLNLHPQKPLIQFSPPPFTEKIFHFTAETIQRLKKEANSGRCSKDMTISSFQALSAHIWLAITRARKLSPSQLTTFKLAVNCRHRIIPPLPYSYFGNAIQFVSATVTSEELLGSGGMAHAAGLLHRIIAAHQNVNIRAELERTPTVGQLDKSSPENTVMMGSSPRFPMYENDFGWGKPRGVRSGWANKFDGKMSAYPGNEGSGSVDIEICLLPHTMTALDSHPHFLLPFFH